ncbi:MAG TPA: hypothetical protein PKD64_07390 [Pirellulaceae bacterium]|nr:hypothetical protein [Pirellulaceae bacterium]HMO92009.1 hypothetical protein [Pirellulaceae bacterium]HMP68808.1 hypothetical protein [Pirellulaceae bacterium]
MASKIYRLVVRSTKGELSTKDFETLEDISRQYEQIGIDDCSTDLSLRGLPVFRGLVGPIPESKGIARYESPDVFEMLTKEWSKLKVKRRRRSALEIQQAAAEKASNASVPRPALLDLPKTRHASATRVSD